jgi:uncharacterized protein DUF1214
MIDMKTPPKIQVDTMDAGKFFAYAAELVKLQPPHTIHFDKAAIPPVNAFWSITLYDKEGYQVANSLNRFAVSSWMPFQYNPDGSLDLYFQNESPGADKESGILKGRVLTLDISGRPRLPSAYFGECSSSFFTRSRRGEN